MAAYATDYMKRIAFLDGQVLHDFHLNIMQKNIAESIKLKTTRERYDFYLLVSPYSMYFHEPFVDNTDRDSASTATLNTLNFSISQGSWESSLLELPITTSEINLVSNFEDYPSQGAHVNFYYRTAKDNQWIPITPDQPVYLSVPKKYFQVKTECLYTGTIRPAVYDYALMWK
jgi:hypothetical protein